MEGRQVRDDRGRAMMTTRRDNMLTPGVQVLGWSLLGAVCGLFLGFGVGTIHAPTVNPADTLEHEWYTPFVFFIFMPAEALGGLIVGLGVAAGSRTPSRACEAFALSLGGAILGAGLGWVLVRVFRLQFFDWKDDSEVVSSLLFQSVGVAVGTIIAVARQWPEPKP